MKLPLSAHTNFWIFELLGRNYWLMNFIDIIVFLLLLSYYYYYFFSLFFIITSVIFLYYYSIFIIINIIIISFVYFLLVSFFSFNKRNARRAQNTKSDSKELCENYTK